MKKRKRQQEIQHFLTKKDIRERCKGVHRVDLGKSFPTHIYLQKLASIQPRTVARSPRAEHYYYYFLLLQFPQVFYFHKNMPKGDGAILIFLPGWGDISKLFLKLYETGENFKLITLHSLMTPEQQHEAFERPPKGMRKVVLSTNIAEASVTIDDVVYVIDSGVRKARPESF